MKRERLIAALIFAPVFGWLGYGLLAHRAALMISHRWGQRLLQAGDGKFSDVAVFLQHRFYDGAWLLTLTAALVLATLGVGVVAGRRLPAFWRWVPYSLAGFVAVNVWLKFAFATCLFWCLFWNGKGQTSNLTQFHIKLLLMNESAAPKKVVLAGSSQVRTQIDARLLNQRFGSNVLTTELHFPGNKSFDFLLLNRQLEGHQADVILCYLSELNFFAQGMSEGSMYFFTFRDWPEFVRQGGELRWSPRTLSYGLIGDVLPIFWIREPLSDSSLGLALANLQQERHDSALDSNLSDRAAQAAATYRSDAQSDFSFRCFEAFVAQCRSRGRTVVACCGQLNPILARDLSPAMRPQMRSFLLRLAASYDNFILLDENALPRQTEADYEDLTHVGTATRTRFTETIASVLEGLKALKPRGAGRDAALGARAGISQSLATVGYPIRSVGSVDPQATPLSSGDQ